MARKPPGQPGLPPITSAADREAELQNYENLVLRVVDQLEWSLVYKEQNDGSNLCKGTCSISPSELRRAGGNISFARGGMYNISSAFLRSPTFVPVAVPVVMLGDGSPEYLPGWRVTPTAEQTLVEWVLEVLDEEGFRDVDWVGPVL
ncbi:hypothetical protein [Muricoccus vinaceus]|uniref:Uncharacterized protein n=1 Tax=Muricoccus vinaceus TaxID=424704 RepID=A0ABV6IM93_9PROT